MRSKLNPDKISSPIKWWGGKKYQLKHILPLIPQHTCYVEVFGGARHVFFAKPPSEVEIYNDLDGRLVNFFLCLKYHPTALMAEIDTILHSREMYKHKFSISDHHRLARVLKEVQGKWLLSYNNSTFIRGKYRRYHIKCILNKVQTGHGKVGHHRELLITNYGPKNL